MSETVKVKPYYKKINGKLVKVKGYIRKVTKKAKQAVKKAEAEVVEEFYAQLTKFKLGRGLKKYLKAKNLKGDLKAIKEITRITREADQLAKKLEKKYGKKVADEFNREVLTYLKSQVKKVGRANFDLVVKNIKRLYNKFTGK